VQLLDHLGGPGAVGQEALLGHLHHDQFSGKACGRHEFGEQFHQAPGEQLGGGDVDRHLQVRAGGLPASGLGDGQPQRALGDRRHQPEPAGRAEELPGRHQAAARVAPAHQRLDRSDVAGVQVDLRLVPELELVADHGLAQLGTEFQTAARVVVTFGVVDAARHVIGLGLGERDVRAAQQVSGVPCGVVGDGDAEGGVQRHPDALDQRGAPDDVPPQLRDRAEPGRIAVRVAQAVLVAAEPADQHLGGALGAQPGADGAQQGVPGHVAQRVVDLGEPLEVQQDQAHLARRASASRTPAAVSESRAGPRAR
jgi:hypothetical protein